MGAGDVHTFGLVQVFMWGSQRINTIEGVKGKRRKMLKEVRKQMTALYFC